MIRIPSVSVFASIIGLLTCIHPLEAEPVERPPESATAAVDSLLLDQYPDAHAAYSLRKLRSGYSGPAIRVRRASDGAEQDFGFGSSNILDVGAIETWLSGADGYVTTWYSQVEGEPNLVQDDQTHQPRIAESGTVFKDSGGRVAIKFEGSKNTHLGLSASLTRSFAIEQSLVFAVGEKLSESSTNGIVSLSNPGDADYNTLRFGAWQDGGFHERDGISNHSWAKMSTAGFWGINHDGTTQTIFSNHAAVETDPIDGSVNTSGLTVGVEAWQVSSGFDGYLSEVAILPGQSTEADVQDVYDLVNVDWDLGPKDYNRGAILPQRTDWLVALYDWLQTISTDDVTLPEGTLTYDYEYETADELADIWLKTRKLTASSVTRRSPDWYVLDNGNGKGIEATGVVRANHNPKGNGDYGGNPPRSWQNEPAYWYKLDLPLADGSQGNPWHQSDAMGRRAMIVSTVDLMMHQGLDDSDAQDWFDMKGKAFLGMAEALRWAGDVLPPEAREAYVQGMEEIVDDLIARGPRAVNTNMDMFALQGAADLYMATDDAVLKEKCVKLVRKALFGYTDGELGTKHKVFAAGGGQNGGVFDPSGFIMEGDQPDVFYGGESIHQLAGALEAVTNRETGAVPSEWAFLEEVVRRLQEWRTYQAFYDPGVSSPAVGGTREATFVTAGNGFSGRTSYGVPHGQAGGPWKAFSIASRWPDFAYKGWVPSVSSMENAIASTLSTMNDEMSSAYTESQPDQWKGWSPWTKHTAYVPPTNWYSDLKSLHAEGSEYTEPPAARNNVFWNKALGGPPTGKQYWSYKQEDGNGEAWGFFVEAQAQQGKYGGWYGGKIETFWTESTGVVLLNRHGKTGCDRSGVDDYSGNEDSTCWFNLDRKAGHHVWGRDENGGGFTTLLLRGRNLDRTSTFNTQGTPPTVQVKNVFNDPSQPVGKAGESGEQTGSEIQGSFSVANKFEAQSDGLKVTHTLTSDQSDEVTELWASLPVYLRHYNPHRGGDQKQSNLEDTSIEYWDGSQWVSVPEDTDGDGVPEIVETDALRLGRNFQLGDGTQYVYVALGTTQQVRLSTGKYYDPYQSRTGVRTVHIDLHGSPGTAKKLPAEKSLSYTLQTTEPTLGESTSATQEIFLEQGDNLVSSYLIPDAPAMDSVFAGLHSEIEIVRNEAGDRYNPTEDINEIGQWNSEEAYLVRVQSDVTLSIEGDSLGSPSIELDQGENWIPYFPASALSVEEAVSSIGNDVIRVRDEDGRAYFPMKDPDVLKKMKPGEGYLINVRESTTLTYPESGN